MQIHTLEAFGHRHDFLGAHHARNERRTWMVIGLCTAMMVIEIVGGAHFGSMALIADGLHMSTHAIAFLIAALAYTLARRHRDDERFAFGTGKFGDLAAFTSAIILGLIALAIGWESITRLIRPVPIAFREAIPIAVAGLAANLVSALMLREPHHHDHHHHHHEHETAHSHAHADGHGYGHGHEDLNLRAAYVHVLADAAVSLLALIGLVAGWLWGFLRMDPIMGLIGTCVIASWSVGLLRNAGAVLLDVCVDRKLAVTIRARLEVGTDLVSDLHLWRLGPGHAGMIASIVSDCPQPPSVYKARLQDIEGLSHITIEVVPYPDP